MSVTRIPERFIYICDRCGAERTTDPARESIFNGTPVGWGKLELFSHVSGGMQRWLICDDCKIIATGIIEKFTVML